MKRIQCKTQFKNGRGCFTILDKSLIGRSFYLQGSLNGEVWVNIPWGAPFQDDEDVVDTTDYESYAIESISMTLWVSYGGYDYFRLILKEN